MNSLNIGALSAINIAVINDKGALETTITLEEFFRVAKESAHLLPQHCAMRRIGLRSHCIKKR